ncbi:MAG TPA: phosphate regulon sensor histidine kinase PhoR [Pseudomonadales bacterium]|nr:phosphate regulon sensor histidine kinase PhoR [Pseudomonadales bacterium]
MNTWALELLWLAGVSLLGALGGAFVGMPMAGAFLGLLVFTLWRLRDLHRFQHWLGHSIGRPPPLGSALEDLSFRIWRQRRAARERTRRLARLLRQLQRATNALPDAAVLLDAQEGIIWFNEAGSRLLGLRRGDIGRSLSVLLRSPKIHALLADTAGETNVEMTAPADEGRTLDVRMIAYTGDRRLLLARDVTQIAQLRTMRQDFIANVSHELRTPLTVVIGYLEALDDEADPALLRATLKRLRRPATRMKTLVEDLLLLSRLDTSAPPAADTLTEVDTAALIRRICADATALTDSRHRFQLELDDELYLRGIDLELHSAFGNMILNAIRYSPDGGDIRVSWLPDGEGARFAVTDEGLGISEEHLPRLTERFYRVDVGRSREAGGTGLGLAIVKHVLRRHDSELEVESRLGVGSTFSCRFGPGQVVARAHRVRHETVTVA